MAGDIRDTSRTIVANGKCTVKLHQKTTISDTGMKFGEGHYRITTSVTKKCPPLVVFYYDLLMVHSVAMYFF